MLDAVWCSPSESCRVGRDTGVLGLVPRDCVHLSIYISLLRHYNGDEVLCRSISSTAHSFRSSSGEEGTM